MIFVFWSEASWRKNASFLLFSSLFPEDNKGSSLQPFEETRRKFPLLQKLGASGGFQPKCSSGGWHLQVRTAAISCNLQVSREMATVQQRQQFCVILIFAVSVSSLWWNFSWLLKEGDLQLNGLYWKRNAGVHKCSELNSGITGELWAREV